MDAKQHWTEMRIQMQRRPQKQVKDPVVHIRVQWIVETQK